MHLTSCFATFVASDVFVNTAAGTPSCQEVPTYCLQTGQCIGPMGAAVPRLERADERPGVHGIPRLQFRKLPGRRGPTSVETTVDIHLAIIIYSTCGTFCRRRSNSLQTNSTARKEVSFSTRDVCIYFKDFTRSGNIIARLNFNGITPIG